MSGVTGPKAHSSTEIPLATAQEGQVDSGPSASKPRRADDSSSSAQRLAPELSGLQSHRVRKNSTASVQADGAAEFSADWLAALDWIYAPNATEVAARSSAKGKTRATPGPAISDAPLPPVAVRTSLSKTLPPIQARTIGKPTADSVSTPSGSGPRAQPTRASTPPPQTNLRGATPLARPEPAPLVRREPAPLAPQEPTAPAISAEAQGHIRQMAAISGKVKSRFRPGVDLFNNKPSSPQYQFAKKQLSETERNELSSALEHLIKHGGSQELDLTADKAVQMWLAVQHARLRTHTTEQRKDHRFGQVAKAVGVPLATAAWPAVMMVGGVVSTVAEDQDEMSGLILAPMTLIKGIRKEHKNYYRDPTRPEYGAAFNGFMSILGDPAVPALHKQTIAKELVERHLKNEKTIAPMDNDAIVRAMGGPERRRGHTVRRAPRDINAQMHDAVIQLAADGYRHDPNAAATRAAARLERENMLAERDRQRAEASTAAPLGTNMQRALEKANASLVAEGLPPLPPLKTLNAYDKANNADAFSRLLERIEDPGSQTARNQVTPDVKSALYRNAGKIIHAISQDPQLRQQIFDDSVGGLAHCNNNVLEVFSRLTSLAERHIMGKKIVAGEVSLSEFRASAMQKFRLETLENYVVQHMLADPNRRDEFSGVQPEVALRLKSDLKTELDLGDSVVPVTVPYWKPKKGDIEKAQQHVESMANNPQAVNDFFASDPSWREGILAFVERENPKDALQLHAFTKRDEFYPVSESTVSNGKEEVTHEGVMLARKAADQLEEIFHPAGQRIWGNSIEQDKFKTDVPEHQALYDRIAKANNEFGESLRDVGRQLTRHVAPFALGAEAQLPRDGKFVPTFQLAGAWDDKIAQLQQESKAAEAVELRQKFNDKHAHALDLVSEMDSLRTEHPDLRDMEKSQIDQHLDALAERLRLRAANKPVPEAAPHLLSDGITLLNTKLTLYTKFSNELDAMKERLQQLDEIE